MWRRQCKGDTEGKGVETNETLRYSELNPAKGLSSLHRQLDKPLMSTRNFIVSLFTIIHAQKIVATHVLVIQIKLYVKHHLYTSGRLVEIIQQRLKFTHIHGLVFPVPVLVDQFNGVSHLVGLVDEGTVIVGRS